MYTGRSSVPATSSTASPPPLVKKTRFRLDVSYPEIPRFGITRGTERELAVHNLHDLTKMTLEFQAFDLESSIRQIQWRLHKHTNRDTEVQHKFRYRDKLATELSWLDGNQLIQPSQLASTTSTQD